MSAIYEDLQVIPLQTLGDLSGNTPANTFSSPPQRALGATGLVVVVYTKTAGTSTVALSLVGITPPELESQEFVVNVAKTISTATRSVYIFMPGISRQPDGEGAATSSTAVVQHIGVPIPDRFLLRLTKGDTSDWQIAVAMRRVP